MLYRLQKCGFIPLVGVKSADSGASIVHIKPGKTLQRAAGSKNHYLLLDLKIDHFTVVCLVTWPLNASEARGHIVLIRTCRNIA